MVITKRTKIIPLSFSLLLFCGVATAQPAAFRVRLLGTAGPYLTPDRAEAGLLVVAGPELLLFDCGRGVPERLGQMVLDSRPLHSRRQLRSAAPFSVYLTLLRPLGKSATKRPACRWYDVAV
jgi:hypothetical protein